MTPDCFPCGPRTAYFTLLRFPKWGRKGLVPNPLGLDAGRVR